MATEGLINADIDKNTNKEEINNKVEEENKIKPEHKEGDDEGHDFLDEMITEGIGNVNGVKSQEKEISPKDITNENMQPKNETNNIIGTIDG